MPPKPPPKPPAGPNLAKIKPELAEPWDAKLLAKLKDEEAFTALITERVKALESTL